MKNIDELVSKILESDTDPNGSYTGTVRDVEEDETPVQDADDL